MYAEAVGPVRLPITPPRVAARRSLFLLGALALAFLVGIGALAWWSATGTDRPASNAVGDKLPVSFIENVGQVDHAASFYVHEAGATIFFTAEGLTISLSQGLRDDVVNHSLRLEFLGVGPETSIESVESATGVVNIFRGADPNSWFTGIPTHSEIAYLEPWPGIDVHFAGTNGRVESVYVVSPGADPDSIQLRYTGQSKLSLNAIGDLVLETPAGTLIERAPVIYQESGSQRTIVDGAYVLIDSQTVGFSVGAYDHDRPLIIDPTFVYSTYLGGSGSEKGSAIAVDSSGNAYIAGLTTSTNFPVVGGGFQTGSAGDRDAFVTKLNAAGSLVYSTYLGGSGFDQANSIAVDSSGNAYVAGLTASTDFPTASAFQALSGGGDDAFVTKLNASGTGLIYSTYVGGSGDDEANGIAIDGAENAYIAGETLSGNYPVASPFQAVLIDDDAFVTKLNATGSALLYSTYLGGLGVDEAHAISVDSGGNAYVTGSTAAANFPTVVALQGALGGGFDAFVTKFSASGAPAYSTYLGGNGNDHGFGIAVDSSGNAHVAGLTGSTNFPIANALQPANAGGDDAFVATLDSAGTGLIYSTYLGGTGGEGATSLALDSSGNAFVTGSTVSTNFPTVSPLQSSAGGSGDAFVTKLAASGTSLDYSTYLGGTANDRGWGIAVDSSGDAYITGATFSTGFPTVSALQSVYAGLGDGFVTRLDPITVPTPTPDPSDTDGDGCSNERELGPDETLGGRRDPLYVWDYYDVSEPRDGVIDLPNDILGVILEFAPGGYLSGAVDHLGITIIDIYDRGSVIPGSEGHWVRSSPDGVIDLPNDILGVILQFQHNCA